ncbi:hypothetical protein CC2G_002566 [Coprinopsis cinerea AmutBmut pab1-1]|nr:hypothetical protein CC2G_002566 [Coprinopsis cinerea AmutBmut pab1-1]
MRETRATPEVSCSKRGFSWIWIRQGNSPQSGTWDAIGILDQVRVLRLANGYLDSFISFLTKSCMYMCTNRPGFVVLL